MGRKKLERERLVALNPAIKSFLDFQRF